MAEKKSDIIEVNILANDEMKAKITFNTNETDCAFTTETKPSISNNQPNNNEQLFDENDNNQQNQNTRNIFKQIKRFCFPGNSKKDKKQQRPSTNSTEALLEDMSIFQCRCNMSMVENVLLVTAIIIIVAIYLIPMVLYYTRPSTMEIDGSIANYFKTCNFPVSTSHNLLTYNYYTYIHMYVPSRHI